MSDSSHKPESTQPATLPIGDTPTESLEVRPDLLRFDQPTFIAQRGQPTPPLMAKASMTPSDLGRVLVGERLGHFELDGYVGGGGMGAVFRAKDTQLGRIVALKVLSRDQSNDDETLRRFRNEAQSAARLDHENIARVYFFGEDRGLHFIVFEFIEGTNARDLVIRQGPLAWAEALNYTLQVADALAHASSRDVVHRDIKPSNIIITESRRAKLVDMGLARLHQVQPGQEDLTASGVTLGTFDYISPEQARDPRSADVRSDIYSLGCTLYFLLTGQPPFPDGTVLQKLLQHQGDDAPDPRQFNPETPPELCAIVRRMLAKDPRKRYQAPASLIADLVAVAAQHGVAPSDRPLSSVTLTSVQPPLTPLERHLPWIVPVAVLIIAAAAVEFLPWPGAGTTQAELAAPAPPTEAEGPGGLPSPVNTGKDNAQRPAPHQPHMNSQQGDSQEGSATSSPTGVPPVETPAPAKSEELPLSRDPLLATPLILGDLETSSPRGTADASDMPAGDESTDAAAPVGSASLGDLLETGDSDPGVTVPSFSAGASLDAGNAPAATPGTATPNNVVGAPVAQERVEVAPPARPGLLVVSETETGPQVYATLAAACAVVPAGAVIELRYDGARTTRPVRLSNADLTIRGGAGFRPEIVFAPGSADSVRSMAALFGLTGGNLRLVNVAVSLHATAEAAPVALTLIEVESAGAVRLEQCVLTVVCPDALAGGFARLPSMFRVLPPPGGDLGVAVDDLDLDDEGDTALAPATIELSDCVARGEATLVDVLAPQSLHLSWDNGLVACLGRLLHVAEGAAAPARREAAIDVDLRHVTLAARSGLALIETEREADAQPLVDFRVQDCILLHDASAALLEQSGPAAVSEQQRRVAWQGQRNFYEGVDVFWRVRGGSLTAATERLTFRAWQSWWGAGRENLPRAGTVAWRGLPAVERPPHEHTPADYALDGVQADNPARGAAGDGSDAGMQVAQLPLPPTAPIKRPAATDADGMGMPPLE